MKFKKGERSHKIPGDVGQVHSITWEPSDRRPDAYAVWLITPQDMLARIEAEKKADPPLVGLVVYASIIGEEIIVSPPPDTDGNLRLRYWGSLREA